MPARKKKSYKAKMKSRIVPCTDANQRAKASLKEKKRQTDALIKKIAQIRAQQELERQANNSMGTIDGLAN